MAPNLGVSATGYLHYKFFFAPVSLPSSANMYGNVRARKKIFWKSSLTLYFALHLLLHHIPLGHSHVYIFNATSARERERECVCVVCVCVFPLLLIRSNPCPYSDFDAWCGMRICAAALLPLNLSLTHTHTLSLTHKHTQSFSCAHITHINSNTNENGVESKGLILCKSLCEWERKREACQILL